MIRRRGLQQEENESSSSDDEEDAFSALSQKAHSKKRVKYATPSCDATNGRSEKKNSVKDNQAISNYSASESTTDVRESQPSTRPQMTVKSAIKRHHKPNDMRKAKMDALLQELEAEKDHVPKRTKRFVPEKKGSFVVPGEEQLTSNLFVGNLAPSIAEEDLSNLFSQFGEKYIFCLDVAGMWS